MKFRMNDEMTGRVVRITGEGAGRLWFEMNGYTKYQNDHIGVARPGSLVLCLLEYYDPNDQRIHAVGISSMGVGVMRKDMNDTGWKPLESGT